MTQMPSNRIDANTLTKGQLRKLDALRKSVGVDIGERAFKDWLASQPAQTRDRNAEFIAETLWPLVQQGQIALPRGGYLIKRGRGRVVVEPASQ